MSTHRSIFVTVGTTRFDKLVNAISSPDLLQLMHDLGFTHLSLQHGNSIVPTLFLPTIDNSEATTTATVTTIVKVESMQIEVYKYKASLHDDMINADLIISHAGAGSILEALRLQKKLIVVVNEDLMDNHQQELGSALHEQGYLVYCNVLDLGKALRDKGYESLVPFPAPNAKLFADFLDEHLGFN
ncbi:N-acetylglucosaminyldiphosphodolichol N-acetylglucosaminyltransferase catalytic subunit alg13 [Lobosporangium transversale]|nr:N-acetylglucosaminyldiphosphodolichol N-acetylglucosaminyltransferase catalytic subunit alg13 [Lobosporangium transversale]